MAGDRGSGLRNRLTLSKVTDGNVVASETLLDDVPVTASACIEQRLLTFGEGTFAGFWQESEPASGASGCSGPRAIYFMNLGDP